MKKKNTILYLVVLGTILLGAILGIIIGSLMGYSLADMFASDTALTIYIALGAFFVVFLAIFIYDWGRRK